MRFYLSANFEQLRMFYRCVNVYIMFKKILLFQKSVDYIKTSNEYNLRMRRQLIT